MDQTSTTTRRTAGRVKDANHVLVVTIGWLLGLLLAAIFLPLGDLGNSSGIWRYQECSCRPRGLDDLHRRCGSTVSVSRMARSKSGAEQNRIYAVGRFRDSLRACTRWRSGKKVIDYNVTKFDPTRHLKSWRTAWRTLTRKAGLPGFRFHDLRHCAITQLAENVRLDDHCHCRTRQPPDAGTL